MQSPWPHQTGPLTIHSVIIEFRSAGCPIARQDRLCPLAKPHFSLKLTYGAITIRIGILADELMTNESTVCISSQTLEEMLAKYGRLTEFFADLKITQVRDCEVLLCVGG